MNGEPEPAEKNDEKPFILSGTVCTSGSGKLLVLAVGTHSVSGKIKAAVYGEAEEEGGSPLFDKLDKEGKGSVETAAFLKAAAPPCRGSYVARSVALRRRGGAILQLRRRRGRGRVRVQRQGRRIEHGGAHTPEKSRWQTVNVASSSACRIRHARPRF